MRYRLYVLLVLIAVDLTVFAQSNPIKISTISSGIGNSTYLQSIGQSSVVTGTKAAGSYVMRQGFVQPSTRRMAKSIENESPVSIESYPNPFTSQIKIKLSRTSAQPSILELYSIDGSKVWSGEIPANTNEATLVDLDRLHMGKYLLRMQYNNQIITKSLLKL
ncbi:MAG: hypothetical protein RL449_39 [Bacteroidota bacterium]|jgi:hypothetical protein